MNIKASSKMSLNITSQLKFKNNIKSEEEETHITPYWQKKKQLWDHNQYRVLNTELRTFNSSFLEAKISNPRCHKHQNLNTASKCIHIENHPTVNTSMAVYTRMCIFIYLIKQGEFEQIHIYVCACVSYVHKSLEMVAPSHLKTRAIEA